MLLLAPESNFSGTYTRARTRFLEAAKLAGGRLSQICVSEEASDAGLFTDIAWFGPEKPAKALLVVSGIHGVEGFAGSAVQLAVLEYLPELPADTALVLVHVLNPYGMHNLRRVNANNVDLNRNFIFSAEDFTGAPDEYAALDAFLNPQKKPSFDFFDIKLLLKQFRLGSAVLRQAVAGGQYRYPKGMFYGGQQLEPEAAAYLAWLEASALQNVEKMMVIDLHTGLGALGEQTLFLRSDSVSHQVLSNQLNVQIVADSKAASVMAYEHRGGSSEAYRRLFPEAERVCLTVEYGTYSDRRLLHDLRAENQYHHYGKQNLKHWSKKNLKEAFCPHPDIWRKQVVGQGLALIAKAVGYFR